MHGGQLLLLRPAGSPTACSIDSGLACGMVRLTVLQVFYCNRPTVAALMALGGDLAAVTAVLYPAPAATGDGKGPAAASSGSGASRGSVVESDSVEASQLVRGGGEQRTIFKLTVEVRM